MKIRGYVLLASACMVLGCGSEDQQGPEPGVVFSELGVECGDAAPTALACHAFDFTSPFTYSEASCYKGQVYDVYAYNGNLGTTAASLETRVSWASSTPSLADCSKAVVFSNLFLIFGPLKSFIASKSAYGRVVDGKCIVPSVSWTNEMATGNDYRLSVGARRDSTSAAPTRAVRVQTIANGSANQCLSRPVDDGEMCTSDACDPATGRITRVNARQGTSCWTGNGVSVGTGACDASGKCQVGALGTGGGLASSCVL